MTQWYVSEQVGVWNWERWKDPEFDKLHYEALAESDPQKRSGDVHPHAGDHGGYRRLCLVRLQAGVEDLSRWMEPVIVPGDHPYTQWFKKA